MNQLEMSASDPAETAPGSAAPATTPSGPGAPDGGSPGGRSYLLVAGERFGLLALLGVVLVVFSLLRPETFGQVANFQNIATAQAILIVVALALMFPLVGGRFDVSVGGILAISALAVAALMSKHGWALLPAMVAAIGIGSVLGLVNGLIIAYLGVNSIIATIGTSAVMGGIVQGYTGGTPITSGISTTLTDISTQQVLDVPLLFLIALAFGAGAAWVLTQTSPGRKLVATGSNIDAARLVGLDVRRVILVSFVASGTLGGVAGVLQVAAQGSADPGVGGLPFILPPLAAVFLGETTWRPGTYNVAGTIIALLFIGSAISGLVLLGVEPWVSDVFYGGSVVVAIVVSALIKRRRTGTIDVGT